MVHRNNIIFPCNFFPSLISFIICLLFAALPTMAAPALFWEDEISSALQIRDEYYKSIGINSGNSVINSWESSNIEIIKMHLQQAEDPENPLFNLLSGFMAMKANTSEATGFFFNKALSITQDNPGMTWILFIEFHKNKVENWADEALRQLQKQMYSRGASSVPVVAQSLLYFGYCSEKEHDIRVSQSYYNWAKVFDSRLAWPEIRIFWGTIISDPATSMSSLLSLFNLMRTSWRMELRAYQGLFSLALLVGTIFVFSIYLLYFIKYATTALHSISERFSQQISPRIKKTLVVGIFISTLAFGILPFLCLFTVLVWTHLEKREKALFAMAAFLMISYPLTFRISEAFIRTNDPNGIVVAYQKSIDEGFSYGFEHKLATVAKSSGNNFLPHLSLAIFLMKKGDYTGASSQIRIAEQVAPDDPVVLVTSGNIAYHQKQPERAKSYYERSILLYPDLADGYHNLGQYFIDNIETTRGMDLIAEARKMSPVVVDSFIKLNDRFYTSGWPILRKMLQPDYQADYFFKKIFWANSGTWSDANSLWGRRFLGIPYRESFAILLGLLIVIFFLDKQTQIRKRPKRIFHCTLCGEPICNWCKRGLHCRKCYRTICDVKNESLHRQLQVNIVNRKERRKKLIATGLNVIFPGTGMIYTGKTNMFTKGLFITLLTALIYAIQITLMSTIFDTPYWIVSGIFIPLSGILAIYNGVFIIIAIGDTIRELRRRGAPNGS